MSIGQLQKAILTIMREEGLSKNQIAIRMGIAPESVYRMFRPGWNPRYATLVSISKALRRKLGVSFQK